MGNGRSPKISYFESDNMFDANPYGFSDSEDGYVGTLSQEDFDTIMNSFVESYNQSDSRYIDNFNQSIDDEFTSAGTRVIWSSFLDYGAEREYMSSQGIELSEVNSLASKYGLKSTSDYRNLKIDPKMTPSEKELVGKIEGLSLVSRSNLFYLSDIGRQTLNPRDHTEAYSFSRLNDYLIEKNSGVFKRNNPNAVMNFNQNMVALSSLNQTGVKLGFPPIKIVEIDTKPASTKTVGYYSALSGDVINSTIYLYAPHLSSGYSTTNIKNTYSSKSYNNWTVETPISTPIHEFGHHIDASLGKTFNPVSRTGITNYGHKNRDEAFAEAFVAYTLGVKSTKNGNDYYQEFRKYMEQNSLNTFESYFLKNPPIVK